MEKKEENENPDIIAAKAMELDDINNPDDAASFYSKPDDIPETSTLPPLKSYSELTKAYWYQFIDPKVWRSMPIFLVIGILFWCLGLIPNYSKCMLSQSIFAIIAGVILGSIPPIQRLIEGEFLHTGVAFSKQMFMRLAVILYGFRTKLGDIGNVGWGGALAAILMVILTFVIGSVCGIFLFKLRNTQAEVISTGFSICGIAAIMSSAGIINCSSADTSLACIMVIIGGFIDIAIYPSLYAVVDKLFGSDRNFGIAAGISIKEIAHTVSVGLSCSAEVSKYAMIVKMFKVLILPFGLIAMAFIIPIIHKSEELNSEPIEKPLSYKVLEFFNKVSIPYFAFIFILTTIINSYTNISETAHNVLNEIIIVALSASMFCVGITTNFSKLKEATSWRTLVFCLALYIWVFLFGWLLEFALKDV